MGLLYEKHITNISYILRAAIEDPRFLTLNFIPEYNVFSRKIFARPCKQTFPEIVLSFFAFYGFEYNYENHIISPYHGQLIDLNKRDNTTKEDLCMKR